jgi:predicted amidohydrolase
MSYTIGVNRIGLDGNNHEYNGQSQIIDALGQTVLEAANSEGVFITTLHKNTLTETRERFRFLSDRDYFSIKD